MKFGTKLNHLIKLGMEIAEEHDGCAVHVDLKGTISEYGQINGAHSMTLESPGQTVVHHNVSIETMISMTGDFKKTLEVGSKAPIA